MQRNLTELVQRNSIITQLIHLRHLNGGQTKLLTRNLGRYTRHRDQPVSRPLRRRPPSHYPDSRTAR